MATGSRRKGFPAHLRRAFSGSNPGQVAAGQDRVGSKPHGLTLLIQPCRVGGRRFDDSLEGLRRPDFCEWTGIEKNQNLLLFRVKSKFISPSR